MLCLPLGPSAFPLLSQVFCVEHCEGFRRILRPPTSEATRTDTGSSQLLALHRLTSIWLSREPALCPTRSSTTRSDHSLTETFKPTLSTVHIQIPVVNPCVYVHMCVWLCFRDTLDLLIELSLHRWHFSVF